MRILITHEGFSDFAGAEGYMLTVAEQLQRTGHEVGIFAAQLGPMADFARTRGVRVLEPFELPDSCELILAQDAASCLESAARYPAAKVIYVAHSYVHMLQTPPQVPGAYHALVALNDRMLTWARGLAHTEPIVRLRQPVDTNRFRVSRPRQNGPPRVLVLTSSQFGSRGDQLALACRRVGVELMGITRGTATPERDIARADAVIATGRSALDAMAASRAVFVLGPLGGDGWVTPESYPQLEADGFTGRSSELMPDADSVAEQLAAWTPSMGNASRDLVARHHDVRDHATELIAIAGELGARPAVRTPGHERELARLVRLEWQRSADLVTTRVDSNRLAGERDDREREVQALRSQVAELTGELERAIRSTEEAVAREAEARGQLYHAAATLHDLVSTRRWRLAIALGRPLDLLRRLRWPAPPGRA
jgi:HAMP domain-containing protein